MNSPATMTASKEQDDAAETMTLAAPVLTCFEGLTWCAWCGGFLGAIYGEAPVDGNQALVSHGICPTCYAKAIGEVAA